MHIFTKKKEAIDRANCTKTDRDCSQAKHAPLMKPLTTGMGKPRSISMTTTYNPIKRRTLRTMKSIVETRTSHSMESTAYRSTHNSQYHTQ